MKWRFRSVRSHLTFLYTLALTLLIGIYSTSLYYLYKQNIFSDFDRKLRGDVEAVEILIENTIKIETKNYTLGFKTLKTDNINSSNWISEIWSSEGQRLFTTGKENYFPLGQSSQHCQNTAIPFELQMGSGLKTRGICLKSEAFPDQFFIRVARLTERYQEQLSSFLSLMLFGTPLILFLSGAVGYLLARQVLSPISKIVTQARLISVDHLSKRLPVENPKDELGELAQTFNKTFERLEASFQQMRRFTSDASHELRTPLSAIRALGEVALRKSQTAQSYQDTIANILEESARLQNLCENLLLLSRADSGALAFKMKPTRLKTVIDDVVGIIGILAEDRKQFLKLEIPGELAIKVDIAFFRQAIMNLIDNAVKYSPEGSSILVWAKSQDHKIFIGIKDTGPGIEAKHHSKIFDRFYRVDDSRSRPTAGAGLGLAITSWIIKTHGGEITLNSEVGQGSEFIIQLPEIRP